MRKPLLSSQVTELCLQATGIWSLIRRIIVLVPQLPARQCEILQHTISSGDRLTCLNKQWCPIVKPPSLFTYSSVVATLAQSTPSIQKSQHTRNFHQIARHKRQPPWSVRNMQNSSGFLISIVGRNKKPISKSSSLLLVCACHLLNAFIFKINELGETNGCVTFTVFEKVYSSIHCGVGRQYAWDTLFPMSGEVADWFLCDMNIGRHSTICWGLVRRPVCHPRISVISRSCTSTYYFRQAQSPSSGWELMQGSCNKPRLP